MLVARPLLPPHPHILHAEWIVLPIGALVVVIQKQKDVDAVGQVGRTGVQGIRLLQGFPI